MHISIDEPSRCFEELSLMDLIATVGLPQDQGAWSSVATEVMSESVFDSQQNADLILDRREPFVSALCVELRSQLSSVCQVIEFWSGSDYCAAEVRSPSQRGMGGRANLFAASKPDGKVALVLTASEWPS